MINPVEFADVIVICVRAQHRKRKVWVEAVLYAIFHPIRGIWVKRRALALMDKIDAHRAAQQKGLVQVIKDGKR